MKTIERDGMSKIKKAAAPKLVFKPVANEWLTPKREQQAEVTRALANEVRRDIYDKLHEGPIRQSVLAQTISRKLGKKFSSALLRHHLQLLERAGLIGFEVNPQIGGKAKMVYRKADVQIQLRSREKPAGLTKGPPRTPEEFSADLKGILKKSSASSKEESSPNKEREKGREKRG